MALDPKYMIAPSVQEVFVDPSTGDPLAAGTVTFYSDVNRSTLKPIYELSGTSGSYSYTPIANPVTLSAGGTFSDGTTDILPYYYPYDSSNNLELYYIVVKDSGGNVKLTRQGYPNVTNQSASSNFGYDFVRNQQFAKWSTSTTFNPIGTGGVVADDWTFTCDDATQSIQISQGLFNPGQSPLPGNPRTFFQYTNTNIGSSAATFNSLVQYYQGVQTLSGETVTISLWAQQSAGTLSGLTVTLNQYFGSGGGSPTTSTVVMLIPFKDGSWTQYTGTAVLPSINGSTIGTGGDDNLSLRINFPLNQTATVAIGNVQMQSGDTISPIIEKSIDDISRGTNYQTTQSLFYTGDVKMTIRNSADTGWLMMNDQTIGNLSSGSAYPSTSAKGLFSLIWTNIHSTIYTPIYDSTGALSTFGTSAEADWNANKRLSLTKALGRVLAGAAPAGFSVSKKITVTPSTSTIAIDDNTSFFTGTPVTFTTTGTLPTTTPTQIVINTTYYAVPSVGNNLQIATTLANAVAGTFLTFTGAGTGTTFVNITYNSKLFGSYDGEQLHQMTINELAAHTHTYSPGVGTQVHVSGAGSTTIVEFNALTGSTGGNTPFNIIQPTTYMNVMIKL